MLKKIIINIFWFSFLIVLLFLRYDGNTKKETTVIMHVFVRKEEAIIFYSGEHNTFLNVVHIIIAMVL